MFQATGLGHNRQRPPVMHAYGGAKIEMAKALQSIASEGWIPLAAAMVGTVGKKPLWADLGLRPVVGTTVDIKLWPSPLKHRDVVLLLSCWKRWDHGSISESAINTWLKNVNLTYGPDCEDSPHFRRNGINDLEAMQLLVDSGFDFLPETDLKKRPCLDMVMTVGLQLCALEILLFLRPEAASKAKRDATLLRLISWLSYKLNSELELFIEQAMEHLSTWEESEGGKVLTMGRKAIQQGEAINTETELRDRLIDLVSVGNLRHKPEALFALFRQFLRRISLPRLILFFDLVLPQLMPAQAAWAGEEKTLWSCHHIRHLRAQEYANRTRCVQISYFFTSHDHVHHVRIQWNGHPLLLFSDPLMVEARPADHFRKQASHVTHQQHLQMGLRKGMAILLYYVVGCTH